TGELFLRLGLLALEIDGLAERWLPALLPDGGLRSKRLLARRLHYAIGRRRGIGLLAQLLQRQGNGFGPVSPARLEDLEHLLGQLSLGFMLLLTHRLTSHPGVCRTIAAG